MTTLMKYSKIYLCLVVAVFAAFVLVFNFFERPRISELEKRELATFPRFSWDLLASGEFTDSVSKWYSDSEPYRDRFMSMSMNIKDYLALKVTQDEEEQITFHASADEPKQNDEGVENRNIGEYKNTVTADENAKIAHAGILILGKEPTARALMAYGGGPEGGVAYANAANKYKEVFGRGVNVYCMVIPTAIEFYCPESAKSSTKSQRATINNIFAHLSDSVRAVDIYTTLGEHAAEDIYLRTDHHWAPLGAYYAARKFAAIAGVPFRDLQAYERKVIHDYVGTMYGYSKDISIKNSPEDFVYYVPKEVEYTTTYTNYSIDKSYKVTGEGKPFQGQFFATFKDGSGGAYSTFMGGDAKITRVQTGTHNGRRVLVMKDSFGNAIPGYLFYSFEEVHVIDFRYFTRNMKNYVRENKITDILMANNTFMAYNPTTANSYIRFLDQ